MDYELAKDLADNTVEMWIKMEAIADLTGWEIYETFPQIDVYYYLFLRMVNGVACDYSYDRFTAYKDGEIDFDALLEEIRWEVVE